jgi:hypothetical protein
VGAFLFGVIGSLIEHAIGKNKGKKSVIDVKEQLSFTLHERVEEILESTIEINDLSSKIAINDPQLNYVLSIKPILVLTGIHDSKEIRPFIILTTTLGDGKQQEYDDDEEQKKWSARYVSSIGDNRLLAGKDSWTENNNYRLNQFIIENVDALIELILTDYNSPYDRESEDFVVVEGNIPYVKDVYRLLGLKLAEDKRSITYIPKQQNMHLTQSIVVVDKNAVLYRKATKKDPDFVRIKSKKEI